MCQFCTKHGEGKKWYLEAKNYSDDLWNSGGRRKSAEKFVKELGTNSYVDSFKNLVSIPEDSVFGKLMRSAVEGRYRKNHYGQLVPIEDVEKIFDISNSVTRLACICRYSTRGKEMRYCFGVTTPSKSVFGQYPEFGDTFEELDKENAIETIRSLEHDGMTHSVWTMGTPYVLGVCNCDNDCLSYRALRYGGLKLMFKAEYVAAVDMELCRGCRNCMRQCQYGAISFSVPQKRCFVDIAKCFGCGICRATCSKNAISLLDRTAIPAVRNVWLSL